jgi:hypothetical protein
MKKLKKSAIPINTCAGGTWIPIALFRNESEIIIRRKLVIINRKEGRRAKNASKKRMSRALVPVPASPASMLMSIEDSPSAAEREIVAGLGIFDSDMEVFSVNVSEIIGIKIPKTTNSDIKSGKNFLNLLFVIFAIFLFC